MLESLLIDENLNYLNDGSPTHVSAATQPVRQEEPMYNYKKGRRDVLRDRNYLKP